jgi:hypothetical protein
MFRCGCVFCEIDTAGLKLGVGRSLGVGALSATNAPMLLRPALWNMQLAVISTSAMGRFRLR